MKIQSRLFRFLFLILLLSMDGTFSGCDSYRGKSENPESPKVLRPQVSSPENSIHPIPSSSPQPSNLISTPIFLHEYTLANHLTGKWKVHSIDSRRTDASMVSLKKWVNPPEAQAQLTFTIEDHYLGARKLTEVRVEIEFPATESQTPCKINFKLRGNYCCWKMLRFTLSPIDLISESAQDLPVHCSGDRSGHSANELAEILTAALIESPTSPNPGVYHFTHNQDQTRIRLQNPPPKTKMDEINELETEIFLSQDLTKNETDR